MQHINELMKVTIGLELAKPELMPSPNGDLVKFEQAIEDRRIGTLLEIEPLKQALRYAMVLVGIKAHNVPNDREKAVLLQFIQKNYGGHTPAEIRLAFDLAVSGDLDIEDVKCYENFSPLYFASIMNAYRKWARSKHSEIKPKEPELTAEQKLQIDLEYAAYLQKQRNKLPCTMEQLK